VLVLVELDRSEPPVSCNSDHVSERGKVLEAGAAGASFDVTELVGERS
jgi:hypothetical protein